MAIIKKFAAALLLAGAAAAASAADSDIRLNSVGFVPDFPKRASIAATEVSAALLRDANTNALVYRALIDTMTNADTRENLWIADFSAFTTPGRYSLYVPNVGQSPTFTIGSDVYTEPYRVMMLGMYLWRCGAAVNAEYNGVNYSHAACHTKDADLRYIGGSGTRDATGGWHDAGDYNKYIVNSGVTVGLMLKAWEQFWFALENIDLTSVSQSGSIPKYLTEIKWNLDWVAKMQHDDGTVSHKISTLGFGGEIMPEAENDTRYFVPWGSAATASFTAMMALAARIYAPYDKPFANACLAKAKRSYEFLAENPTYAAADQTGFSTGGYEEGSRRDYDDRMWAAAELWETTGEERYLKDLEETDLTNVRLRANRIQTVTEWGNVFNLACFTYLNSGRPGRRQELVDSMKTTLTATADEIVAAASAHGYGRPNISYYWGANGAVASTAYTLTQAYRLTGDDKYRRALHDALGHLLGRNYYGRSFVTRVGHNPPKSPHDRTSVASGRPWPGRLIGGPHNSKSEAPANITNCATPAMCWFDVKADYWTNEVAINWNSAMIYALSAALPGSETLPAPCYPGQPECDGTPVRHTQSARPAAAPKVKITRVVKTRGGGINIPPGAKVYGLDGRLIARRGLGDAKMPAIRTNGVYIIRVDNSVNAGNSGGKR